MSRGQSSDSDAATSAQRQPFLSSLLSDLLSSLTSSLSSLRVERLPNFALTAGHPAMAAPKNASFRRRTHRFGEDRTAASGSQPVAHSPTGVGEESAHSSPEPEAESAGDEGPCGSAAEEAKLPEAAAACSSSEETHDVMPPADADPPTGAPAAIATESGESG